MKGEGLGEAFLTVFCYSKEVVFTFVLVLYGIVCIIKIEGSTVSLQDKTMWFIYPSSF